MDISHNKNRQINKQVFPQKHNFHKSSNVTARTKPRLDKQV